MTTGKCLLDVNSKEELDDIRNRSPISVTFINSKNCGHCKAVYPDLEKGCEQIKDKIPVIDCPVDKDFCLQEARELKATGVPFIVGKMGNSPEPMFKIEGADRKKIDDTFITIKELMKNGDA